MCVDCQENSSILPIGPTGAMGNAGTNGTNGNTITQGSGVPSNSNGVNGDSYIDVTNNFNLYNKQAGVWVLIGTLKGSNGTGLVKFVVELTGPTVISGTVTYVITNALIAAYGLISASSPGTTTTSFSDFLFNTYEFRPGINSWVSLTPRTTTTTDNSTGDITVTITGFSGTPTKVRLLLIG